MAERCEKTDLLKDQCAHCRGLGNVADPYEGLLIERWLTDAKYSGRCAMNPAHRWSPGDRIALAVYDHPEGPPFDNLGWVCDPCSSRIATPRRG